MKARVNVCVAIINIKAKLNKSIVDVRQSTTNLSSVEHERDLVL